MLNIKFIQENPEKIKQVCKDKGINVNIERLLVLDKKRRELIDKSEKIRAEQKKMTKDEIEQARTLKAKLKPLLLELSEIGKEYQELMLLVPNIYSEDTPIGLEESFNKETSKWGEIPKFDFPIKSHIQLGKDLSLIDFEAGVKTSGFRGYYLKNEAALLQNALMFYAWQKIIEHGFQPMVVPNLIKERALIGSGHFPFGKEEIYQVANPKRLADGSTTKEPLYLAGTSESSLLAYFTDKILEEKDLPIKVCALASAYRSEAGSYGKDIKGLYRLHEFIKVEQVVLCENDLAESEKWHQKMLTYSEEIMQELKLPYRVVQICTGDMGAGKYKMYDIETWMPSRKKYSETHSNSNLTDWQSRRLNIKYKTRDNEKKFVYALNNTVLASPRILIAILEIYQQKDGSIKIPEVLQKYIGKTEIKSGVKSGVRPY